MRNLINRWILVPAVLLGAALVAPRSVSAQAVPVGTRSGDIAPFFTMTSVSPDWGSERNTGFTAGIDYSRLSRGVGQPAIEFRVMSANGLRVNEFSYGGGLKFQSSPFGAIQPYATMLAGFGTINIHPGGPTLTTQTAFMYALGGGLDIQVRPNIKLKADFLQQTWSFSPNHLTPVGLSIGASYSIPFGGFGRER